MSICDALQWSQQELVQQHRSMHQKQNQVVLLFIKTTKYEHNQAYPNSSTEHSEQGCSMASSWSQTLHSHCSSDPYLTFSLQSEQPNYDLLIQQKIRCIQIPSMEFEYVSNVVQSDLSLNSSVALQLTLLSL